MEFCNRRIFIKSFFSLFIVTNFINKNLSAKEIIKKTREEWKRILTEQQYYVLIKEGTEAPFSSLLNNEKREGNFYCVGCNNKLFSSKMKYDSGTGWPSFFESYKNAVETKIDFKLIYPRTEYHCSKCGGHHGHLFDDGPEPSGKRYCNNGVVLKFVAEKISL